MYTVDSDKNPAAEFTSIIVLKNGGAAAIEKLNEAAKAAFNVKLILFST